MRTTLTLDDDVATRLADLQRRSGEGYKTLVNKALRAGLQVLDRAGEKPQKQRYRLRTSSGGRALVDVTSISDALARAEGEAHK